ncbi:alpha/beta hydrolase [Alphaproteobacteria bacterium]|nr:alpha/beta hydrolase [Alphaproteobacteria bacterium]
MLQTEGAAGGPFKKRTVDLSSGPVTYHIAGDGPPVLYFHSAGGVRYTYALDELAADYTIYMMVAPGFDGTPAHDGVNTMPALADLAAEFVDNIIGEVCDVIGQSFGGFLSIWYTVRHPHKVGFLVPQCPSGFRPKDIPQKPSGTPEEMRSRMFAHPERIPLGEKTPVQLAESRKWANYYHNSVGLDDTLVARLGDIECQTLILQGTKDGMMPPESGQLLMREIPRAKLLYVYDAGHNIEVDQPERFVALIRDFLTRGESFIVNPGDELAGVGVGAG